jgi:hypothetical protein
LWSKAEIEKFSFTKENWKGIKLLGNEIFNLFQFQFYVCKNPELILS